MATKDDVIRLHRKHPDWTPQEIAEHLECMPEYVRATAKRQSLSLPLGFGNGGETHRAIYKLGREAAKLGLSKRDLKRLAATLGKSAP